MKPILILSLSLASCLSLVSNGQEEPKAPMSNQALLEKAAPGSEHQKLAALAGNWSVTIRTGKRRFVEGTATMRMAVRDRFLVCEYEAGEGRFEQVGIFVIGFDRRHGEWTLQAMDNSGTYAVHSRGKGEDGPNRCKLYGKDDDPHMKAMGFEKEFAHVLDFKDKDHFVIEVHFIDTRSEARREHKAVSFEFARKEKPVE